MDSKQSVAMRRIIAISGPTCGGKTTLKNRLLADQQFIGIITSTTRTRRRGERDGADYYFRRSDEFERLRQDGLMLESVKVGGAWYGIEITEIERVVTHEEVGVVVVTPEGIEALENWCEERGIGVTRILVTAPTEVLRARLMRRRGNAEDSEIRERIANLENEIERYYAVRDWDWVEGTR